MVTDDGIVQGSFHQCPWFDRIAKTLSFTTSTSVYGLHVLPNRTSGHDPFNWHAMLTFSVQARIAGRCYLACQIRSNALMGKGALHQVDVVSVRISEAHPISNDFSHLYAWTIALRNQNPKYLKQLNDESCRLTCMRRECVTKSIGDSF